jgi:hypothetical protein
MYVTRAALDRCGLLDEEAFGRGYGEEVDFCLRASRMGMRHLAEIRRSSTTAAAFFRRVSKRRLGAQLGDHRRALSVLPPANTYERAHDPLSVSFAALELGLHERDAERPHVLHLLHSPPGETGGTEKYVDALVRSMEAEIRFLGALPGGVGLRTPRDVDRRRRARRAEFLLPGGPTQVVEMFDEVSRAALVAGARLFRVRRRCTCTT